MGVLRIVLKYSLELFLPVMLLVMFINSIGLVLFQSNLDPSFLMNSYVGFESLNNFIDDIQNNIVNTSINLLFKSLNQLLKDSGLGFMEMLSNFNAETVGNFIAMLFVGPFAVLLDLVMVIVAILSFVVGIFEPITRLLTGYYNLEYNFSYSNLPPLVHN